ALQSISALCRAHASARAAGSMATKFGGGVGLHAATPKAHSAVRHALRTAIPPTDALCRLPANLTVGGSIHTLWELDTKLGCISATGACDYLTGDAASVSPHIRGVVSKRRGKISPGAPTRDRLSRSVLVDLELLARLWVRPGVSCCLRLRLQIPGGHQGRAVSLGPLCA